MNTNLNIKWNTWLTACLMLLASHTVTAEMNLNGFATMATGMTLSSDQSLNGYDNDLIFDQNSFLGLQANADLDDGLSAVAQIVSRGRNDWEAEFEWAYIGYELSDHVKLIAGKQRWPFYMYSDYVDVSYAYHWITPPESVYSLPFNSATGVGVLITGSIGDASSTLHLITGRNRGSLESDDVDVPTDIKNMLGFSWTLDFDWLTFRVGYTASDLSFQFADVEPLAAAWAAAGQAFSEITMDPSYATEWAGFSDDILANDGNEKGSFGGVGFILDYNDFIAVAEYTTLETEGSFLQEEGEGYYFSFGKRFGNLLPHITYGVNEVTPASTAFLNDVPRGVSQDIDGLIAGTEAAFNASAVDQSYYIVGLRWDFHPAAAFKIDFKSQEDELPTNVTNELLRCAIVTVF